MLVGYIKQPFVVSGATGQALAYVYFRHDENEARQARVLTRDEASRSQTTMLGVIWQLRDRS